MMEEKKEIEVTCGRCDGTGEMNKKVIRRVRCYQCGGKGHITVKKAEP
jgi:DnaJ-class molecular chaperone